MESGVERLVFAVANVSKETGVDVVAEWIERATGIKFERRQGDYAGGNYCQASGPCEEELRIQKITFRSPTTGWRMIFVTTRYWCMSEAREGPNGLRD
jgi:hypothetical protein